MNWIKVSVSIGRDGSIHELAEASGVAVPVAVGHFVLVLAAMAEGVLDGDLSGVRDSILEDWARWRGRNGRFAAALRAHLCTPEGVVRSWAKYNGTKLKDLEADRERKRAEREQRRLDRINASAQRSPGRPPDGPPDDSRTSPSCPPLRDVTRRDVTRRDELTAEQPRGTVAKKPRPATPEPAAAKWPDFPLDARQAAFAYWQEKIGTVEFGVLVNAIGPHWKPDKADVCRMAVRDYCGLITRGRSAPFASPADLAKRLGALISNAERNRLDAATRTEQAKVILHGRQEAA